jgi:chemotaxis protein MotB
MQTGLRLIKGFPLWSIVLTTFIVSYSVVFLNGCASSSKYNAAIEERDALSNRLRQVEAENESLKSKLQGQTKTWGERILVLDENVQKLEDEKRDLDAQLQAQRKAAEAARSLHSDLVSDLKSELAAHQVKVDLLKSGIRVSMPGEVLFGSGSTALTGSGQEMLLKVSAKLKDSPYLTVVAGFTDNVPIGGALADRYPTNWELAGARAARVVRLLEEAGVPSERLFAVSYGENQPVASNDDEEGRAKNRRIEIRLRLVE